MQLTEKWPYRLSIWLPLWAALLLLTLFLPLAAHAQWQASSSNSNDIHNTNSGNVGVGTTNPTNELDIASTGGATTLGLRSDANQISQLGFYHGGTDLWYLSSRGAADAPSSRLSFYSNNSGVYNERLTILSGGNVGIGTASPNLVGWFSTQRVLTVQGPSERGVLELGNPSTGTAGVAASIAGLNATTRLGQIDIVADGAVNSGHIAFFTNNAGTLGERLRIDKAGNVGIGTTNPTVALDVTGNLRATGTITGGSISATYQDIAEWVTAREGALPAGTVVIIDPEEPNRVLTSAAAYDTRVAGVVSAQPGLILGEAGEGRVMVATTGRVRVRVDATRAPIRMGDLLVTSNTPGVAMRSLPLDLGGTPIHRPGTLIGKALEPLERGIGEILVLLSLQ